MLSCAGLIASGLAVAPAALAATTASAQRADVTESPNVASAQAAAKAVKHRVRVVELDDEMTSTFVNPDGTFTTDAYAGPIRVRQQDKLVDLDTTLSYRNGVVEPAAVPAKVRLSAGGDGPLVVGQNTAGAFGYGWNGRLPEPVLAGNTATYPGVQNGVDLIVQVTATGFEVSARLTQRPKDELVISLPLVTRGIRVAKRADGGLRLTDNNGKDVGTSDAPVMFDSSVDPSTKEPRRRAPLASDLESSGTGQALVLRPDRAFLDDPAVMWPIVLDPTTNLSDSSDTWVQSNSSTSLWNSTELRVGTPDNGTIIDRAYLKFSTTAVTNKHVLSANLFLHNWSSINCTPSYLNVYRLNVAFTSSTIWSNKPSGSTYITQKAFAHGSTGCPAAYESIPITSMVADWASGTQTNYGLALVAPSETSNAYYKKFTSADQGSNTPYISTTYNSYPARVAGRSVTPCVSSCAQPYLTNTTQPYLTANADDADGGTVRYDYEIYVGNSATPTVLAASGSLSNVPEGTEGKWHVPASANLANATYEYRARAFDGTDYGPWSTGYSVFDIDATVPTAATVTSSTHPSGAWTAASSGTFAFAATDAGSGLDHYLYGLDSPTPNLATASGVSSATLSVADGWHTLYARAVDRAGNLSSSITAYSFGAGSAHVVTPVAGAVTSASVNLSASAPVGASQVSFYYRRTDVDVWALVPLADVTGTTVWPFSFTPFTGNTQQSPTLGWGAKTSVSSIDGPIQVAACFGSATACPAAPGATLPTGSSSPVAFQLDQNTINVAATQQVQGATVNLVTGNAQWSATDVSVPGSNSTSLSVGRSLNGRLAATTTGIFGKGWTAALPVDSAGSDWTGLSDSGSLLNVTGGDQSIVSFALTSAGTYLPAGEDADSGLQISLNTADCASGFRCYALSDLDGNSTIFQSPTGNPAPGPGSTGSPISYTVSKVRQPGSPTATTFGYSNGLVSDIVSPIPASGTCTDPASTSTWSVGCRALHLTYDTGNHLSKVTYRTSDGTNPLQVDVACYGYTGTGASAQLTSEWDPRDIATPNGAGSYPITCDPANPVRPTSYGYDSVGRISTVMPAGLAGISYTFDSTASTGRLVQAQRTSGASTLTDKVLFDVPLTLNGTTSYRPNLTSGATALWAQTDNPDDTVKGTAICPPGAAVTDINGDLRDCTLSYVDVDGHLVNTASYAGSGDAGWHISTSEYDSGGRMIRSLSATNREEALSPTTGAGQALGLPTDTAAAALELSTVNIYKASALDGQPDLVDSFGPYHRVQLATASIVPAREHTKTFYDDGTEPGHPVDGFNQPVALHLVRTVLTGASLSPDPLSTNETDIRTSENRYWLGTASTDAERAGWTYRQPMQTITDPAGLAITSTTLYDPATGNVTESRMPSNTSGGGVGTTLTRYYTADASSPDADCRSKPLWAGLSCKTLPAADARVANVMPSLVTTLTSGYDYLNRATSSVESVTDAAGTVVTRTSSSTFGFNSAANPYASTGYSTTITGGVGAAVPARTFSFYATTGLPMGTSAAATAENPATGTSTSYDGFGRVISYTDDTTAGTGQQNVTATSYEPASGRVAQTSDAHTTTAYTYNGGGEHRGLPTLVTVTVAGSNSYNGTFTASYDPDGQVASQTDPNGIASALTRDEDGQLTGLTDTIASTGGPWASDSAVPSIHSQWLHHANNVGWQDYTYDAVGRLTQAADTPAGGACTTRTYDFTSAALGVDSNRLGSTAYPSLVPEGSCQTAPFTGGTTTAHSYDGADRMTDTGVTYDAFGRTTALPAAQAGGAAFTAAYYANDLVRSQTQNGSTQCWTLDANQQLKRTIKYTGSACTGAVTLDKTNHYGSDGSDSPAWIAEAADGATWTVNVGGVAAGLGITVNQAGVPTYQYANLHGDILATAPNNTAPVFKPDYDEFGNAPAGTPSTRYGWLGGKHRSGEDQGGLVLMGVRLYNPVTGRFLQTDPVEGGSCNRYDYGCQDPINKFDLDGRRWGWGHIKRHMGAIVAVASVASFIPVVGVGFAAVAIAGSAYMASDDFRHRRYVSGVVNAAGAVAGVGDIVMGVRAARAGRALRTANSEYRGATAAARNASGHYRSVERSYRSARVGWHRANTALSVYGVGSYSAHRFGSD